MNKQKIKKTFYSALIIAVGTLLSRFTGLIRDIFFAKYLGSGFVAEAFYVAFRLPNTFRKMFAEGAFSNAFVPFFSTKVKQNKRIANNFSLKVLKLLFIIMSILTILMEIFMPQVIAIINPGFLQDQQKFILSIHLARISFPYIMLISFAAFFGSILNSIGSFWQFSIVSVILNIVLTFGLLFTKNFFENSGECLSLFLIIGGFIQSLFVLYFCIKNTVSPFNLNNVSDIEKKENNKDIRIFLKTLLPAIFSSGILQINIFVDGVFASFFNGANSYFYYTTRIVFFPLSIIGYSLTTAILPSLSVAVHENNSQDIKTLQTKSISIAMFFSIPIISFIFICSNDIIKLIYERGVFTAKDTEIVGNMLKCFILSVPFTILMKIFYSCFYAKKDTKIPLYIGIISLVFNIISNIILMRYIGMYCVVVSTTISSMLSCFILYYFLKRKNSIFIDKQAIYMTLKICFVSIISCFISPVILKDKLPFIVISLICCTIHLILCFCTKTLNKELIRNIIKK